MFGSNKSIKIKWQVSQEALRILVPDSAPVNLDALNQIADGRLIGLMPCRYHAENGKHVFEYPLQNAVPAADATFSEQDAEGFLRDLHGVIDRARRQGFLFGNFLAEPAAVFRAGGQFRFVYLPLAVAAETRDENELVFALMKKLKGRHTRFKQYIKDSRFIGDFALRLPPYAFPSPVTPAAEDDAETTILNAPPGYDAEEETTVLSSPPGYDAEEETTVLSSPPGYDAEGETTVLSSPPGYDAEGETTVLSTPPGYDAEEETTVLSSPPGYDAEGETTVLSSPPGYDAEGETTVLSSPPGYDAEEETTVLSSPPGYDAEGETTVLSSPPGYDAEEETTVLNAPPAGAVRGETGNTGSFSGARTMFYDRDVIGERIRQAVSADHAPISSAGDTAAEPKSGQRVILVSADNRMRFNVPPEGIEVGSRTGSGVITIDNTSVSRRHAAIRVEGDRVYVVDFHSTNGTYVDGVEVAPEEKTEVYNGSFLSFGNVSFQIIVKRV